jgi:hypothetical protein
MAGTSGAKIAVEGVTQQREDYAMSTNRARAVTPRAPSLTRADLAGEMEFLRGRRVVLADFERVWPEYRAWSDLEVDGDGQPWVEVVRERHWWAWDVTGIPPRVLRWPAGAVWVLSEASEAGGRP